MIELEAKYKIITPLFMSGANIKRDAELRAASIKGVLRFWWRALAWGHYEEDWRKVRNAELTLFGSSSAGQSKLHISISAPEELKAKCNSITGLEGLSDGGKYLGYGVIDQRGHPLRPYLSAPLSFDLKIYIRQSDNSSSFDLLEGALKAMGLFGGLGSKSRRGFGSITLQELQQNGVSNYTPANNLEDYRQSLKSFFIKYVKTSIETPGNMPDYTAFSRYSKAYLLEIGDDPLGLLNIIGQKMKMYRSWKSERNFADDHKYMMAALSNPATEYPLRIAFGLPHNYYFLSQRKIFSKPKVEIVPGFLRDGMSIVDKSHNRRASPLIFHIHELSRDSYAAVALTFPSLFLPNDKGLLIQRVRQDGEDEQDIPINVLTVSEDWYKEINKFLESDDPITGQKRFEKFEVIWPEMVDLGEMA